MRRREPVRAPDETPRELARFRLEEWYDPDEPVPAAAYEHMKHNRSTPAECAWVYRAVRAVRRHHDAKAAYEALRNP